MPHTVRFYRFAGRLYLDRHFEWRPGYVTESATGHHDPAKDSDFSVRLLDKKNRVLIDHPINVPWGNRHDDPTRAHLREKVPWHDDTHALVFVERDREIFRATRATKPPVVSFRPDIQAIAKAAADEPVELRWRARSPSGKQLFQYLAYSCDDGERFVPIGSRRLEPGAHIRFSRLPGGQKCRIRLRVTDGLNTVEVVSKAFPRPWVGPTAEIYGPQDGQVVERGSRIEVSGAGHSPQERFPEGGVLEWSLDGKPVSKAANCVVRIPENGKTVSLELKVTDSRGHRARKTHTLVLSEPAEKKEE